jgi:exopolysaccharide biosynthesis protein
VNSDVAKALIGSWVTDPSDIELGKVSEKSRLEFTEDGQLIYTIIGEDKDQKIFLTFQVKNGVLITDQPSHPREEETRFLLTPDGKLVLMYGDQKSTYVRC